MMFNLFGQLAPEEKEQGVPLMLQGVPLANQEQIQEAAKMPTAICLIQNQWLWIYRSLKALKNLNMKKLLMMLT